MIHNIFLEHTFIAIAYCVSTLKQQYTDALGEYYKDRLDMVWLKPSH